MNLPSRSNSTLCETSAKETRLRYPMSNLFSPLQIDRQHSTHTASNANVPRVNILDVQMSDGSPSFNTCPSIIR